MTRRHMRVASWVPKATDTRSEHVILIACPLQQWLHERASVLLHSTLPVCYIVPSMWSVPFRIFDQYFACTSLIYGACPPLI